MRLTQLARRGLARTISAAAGARVVDQASALPQLEQAIFYANHSSHLDFLTIWAALPEHLQQRVRPIAAKDYWGSGLRRSVAERIFNAYLVERHGSSAARTRGSDAGVSPKGQITGMTQVLDAGDSLIIFPEGTRGDGETIAEFHSGLYRLACHNRQIPVIPVALANLGRILPKGEIVPVPHLSTVVFAPAMHVGAEEDKDSFLTRAREQLISMLAQQDQQQGEQ
ncbi:lysophospholipid acyltransferase family protein [Nesterenkonia sp.]|uniref:lysophospholipid acyltransferase family protein n=1 Tax=Nesterenkonia sp. TaxID=704201 RepID=UPI00261535E3|nr:lysophospholipid acyltransferase family protein [Nesterenkonia sp.]